MKNRNRLNNPQRNINASRSSQGVDICSSEIDKREAEYKTQKGFKEKKDRISYPSLARRWLPRWHFLNVLISFGRSEYDPA